jgi:hypothetical protein
MLTTFSSCGKFTKAIINNFEPEQGSDTVDPTSLAYFYTFESDTITQDASGNDVFQNGFSGAKDLVYLKNNQSNATISNDIYNNGASSLNILNGSPVSGTNYCSRAYLKNFTMPYSANQTVFLKVYITSVTGLYASVFATGTTTQTCLKFGFDNATYLSTIIYNGNTVEYIGYFNASPNLIQTNNWYSLAVVKNNDTITIYLNGQYGYNNYTAFNHGSSPTQGAIAVRPSCYIVDASIPTKFYVGRFKDGDATNNWQGNIDDLRIYNRALTQSEIQTLHNNNNLN